LTLCPSLRDCGHTGGVLAVEDLLNRPRVPLAASSLSRNLHAVQNVGNFPVREALPTKVQHLNYRFHFSLMLDLDPIRDFSPIGQRTLSANVLSRPTYWDAELYEVLVDSAFGGIELFRNHRYRQVLGHIFLG